MVCPLTFKVYICYQTQFL